MDKKQVSNEECMYQSMFNFVELCRINVSESESESESNERLSKNEMIKITSFVRKDKRGEWSRKMLPIKAIINNIHLDY